MTLDFYCHIQISGSDLAVNNMKASLHPALYQQVRLLVAWWCGGYCLAHVGPLSTNWLVFKLHSLPNYCCWPWSLWSHCTHPLMAASNRRFITWRNSWQICNDCVMLSCQCGPKIFRNGSSTLLNQCHDKLILLWRKKRAKLVLASCT